MLRPSAPFSAFAFALTLGACAAPAPCPPCNPGPTDGPANPVVVRSKPKEEPLLGVTQLLRHGERLCGIRGKLLRCLINSGVGPTDVEFSEPIEQVAYFGMNEDVCALTRSKRVECKRGAQLVNLPPLTDVVEIAPLQTLTGGICVSRASGELLCLAFHGLESKPLTHAPFVEEGGGLPRASYVEGCLVMRGSGKVVCPNSHPTELEANLRLGWKSWKSGYSYTLPHGGSGQPVWLGLDADAALHGRGGNFFGQLGNGKRGLKPDSSDLSKLGRVSSFDLASTHACAVVSGRVACWGESTAGQVPEDEELELEACDVDMSETKTVWRKQALAQNLAAEQSIRSCRSQPRALDCELGHRPADPNNVPDNFRVFETDGQCIESTTPVDVVIEPKPVFVPELDDAVQVVLSNRVSCALRKNGKVRCWGKPTAFRLNADDGSPY